MQYYNNKKTNCLLQHLSWAHILCFVQRFFKSTRNGNESEWRRKSMWKIFNGELVKKEKHKKRKHKKREETENGTAK